MNKTQSRMVNNDLYFEEVQRLLKEGKEVCIRVKGNSMMPFIKNGDRVIVVAHLGTVLPLGSPILAQYEGKFVFHRYVGKKNGKFVLAGDGNLVLKEYVSAPHILAIATLHYPNNSDTTRNINSRWPRLRGMIWYHLRMVRRLFASLKRRILS
ncbi:S24/S26 family peptidase [Sphingobacterium sp. PCS056]|jgi:hypothetical protein|uniref:S24/S26 family peptidase n=1 Tax=unclassified Sphingobacterium TaxID=2609468 RepID=UPI00200BB2DE|nr:MULTISPECIES: S24/S26 family peptidase [unclassified Sphingobacterium]UPZ37786.1 S24/S26 family peptidase [Sphingobacterium sp. PCS056]